MLIVIQSISFWLRSLLAFTLLSHTPFLPSSFLTDRHNLNAPANFAAFPKPCFDFGGCQSQIMPTFLRGHMPNTNKHWVTYLTTRKHTWKWEQYVSRIGTIRHKHQIFLPIINTVINGSWVSHCVKRVHTDLHTEMHLIHIHNER